MPKIDVRKDGECLALIGQDALEAASYSDELQSTTDARGMLKQRPNSVSGCIGRNITSTTGAASLFKVFGQSRAWDIAERDGRVIATLDAPEGNGVRDLEESTLDGVLVNGWSLEWTAGDEVRETLTVEALQKKARSLLSQDEVTGKTKGP